MSDHTGISWADATWNPATGCTPVSEGCEHCYARRMAYRLWKMGSRKYTHDFRPTPQPPYLVDPAKWRSPRRVFVCSMGDLFHEELPFDFILRVFATMIRHPQHTYLLLTKRPARMLEFYGWWKRICSRGSKDEDYLESDLLPLPYDHIWHGVTIESQRHARERLEPLVKVPSAHRWISCEPLLERVDLRDWFENTYGIEWIVVGGETGPGFRPMKADWARSLRVQCDDAAVHFHFKQHAGVHKGGGRELDGRIYDEMPPFGG